jgi:signal transduction histidine kinase
VIDALAAICPVYGASGVPGPRIWQLQFLLFAMLFAIALTMAPPSSAQESRMEAGNLITTAMPRAWPPHYIAEDGARPTGFAVEILDAVAARAGYQVSYRIIETMREAFDLAANGEVDLMANVGIVEERKKQFTFTDPVETFVVGVFVRTDSQDIQDAADLAGRRVAVIERNVGLRLMGKRKDVESVLFADVRSALFELVAGRVDALIYPAPIVANLARQVGVDNRIKMVGPPLLEVKRAIAVHPGRTEMHRRLSAAVADFVGTPEYQEIYVRWFGAPEPFWSARRILTIAGGVLLAVIGGFSLWHYRTVVRLNRLLETRVEQRSEELRQAQADLLRKERLATLGELTGTMAHELRNPLGAVVSSFAVIKHRLGDNAPELERSIERAERNIGRCTGIIDDLLDYAQIKSANRQPTSPDELLREIVAEYQAPQGVTIVPRLALEGHLARIDREQIRRVILNFLDNACHAIAERAETQPDAPPGEIVVETAQAEGEATIVVSDNGAGIADENRDKVFEPLFSTKPFGVGLGLPGALNTISEHGGKLDVESNHGEGARFTVRLPFAEEEREESMAS